jgi:tetratricopeptide (TPR) repeat protein
MTRTQVVPALAAAALILAACQQMPTTTSPEKPQAVTPQITEEVLRQRAQEFLATGVKQYDAGDYENAEKSLSSSLDHGLLTKVDQSRARKLLAFIYCTSNRDAQCRDQFRKAFEINPEFALTAAEDGHPVWGPVYRDVRTQLISEREAATTVGKSSPAPVNHAQQLLADGVLKYDAGEYDAARKLLEAALKEGLADKSNQTRAMKYVAFTECLQQHFRECRAQFIKIYDVDPNFDLTPAEAGHPSWTHTFASAKAAARRALAAKEKKENTAAKATHDKPATPAASVPAK